jgi:hypothetical protein
VKSDRGSWRSIHTVLVDSPEYLALTPNAKLVLFTLKLRLGPIGIAVIPAPASSLAESTGLSANGAFDALVELQKAGWIRMEGSMIWLVNGLKYEPGYSPKNKWHVQKINELLAALPRVPLVQEFKNYYAEYLGIERQAVADLVPRKSDEGGRTPVGADPYVAPLPAVAPAKTVNNVSWVAEGVAWWCEHVGPINHGRFGTAIKPLVDRFGWSRVFPCLQEYANGGGAQVRIEWFASNGVRLVEKSKGLHRPAWEREKYDREMNTNPKVIFAVNEYRKNLNGRGDEWWEQMKSDAKAQNRHALVYAYEQIKVVQA